MFTLWHDICALFVTSLREIVSLWRFMHQSANLVFEGVFEMKRNLFLLIGAAALAASAAFAQSAPPQAQAGTAASANAASSTAAQANSDAAQLASGTKFEAALNQTLDANKNKVGDTVVAHTTDDVKSNGKVVLPKNTKLVGHITEVKAKSKDDANS